MTFIYFFKGKLQSKRNIGVSRVSWISLGRRKFMGATPTFFRAAHMIYIYIYIYIYIHICISYRLFFYNVLTRNDMIGNCYTSGGVGRNSVILRQKIG